MKKFMFAQLVIVLVGLTSSIYAGCCSCNKSQTQCTPGPTGMQGPTGPTAAYAYFSAFTATGVTANTGSVGSTGTPSAVPSDSLNTMIRILGTTGGTAFSNNVKIPFAQTGPSFGMGTVFSWNGGSGDDTLTFLQAGTFEVTYGLSVYLGVCGMSDTYPTTHNQAYSAGAGLFLGSSFVPQSMLVYWLNHNDLNFGLTSGTQFDGSIADVQFKTISTIIQAQPNQTLSVKAHTLNQNSTNQSFYLGSTLYQDDPFYTDPSPGHVPTLGFITVKQLQ